MERHSRRPGNARGQASRVPRFVWWIGAGLLAVGALAALGLLVVRDREARYTGPRGPYLQNLTPTAVTIHWLTEQPRKGWLRYGPVPGELDRRLDEPRAVVEHIVRVEDLEPGSLYYYAVGFGDQVYAGGTPDYWFRTAPPVGARQPTRIWVIGDSGAATDTARSVRNARLAWVEAHPRGPAVPVNLWLALGDNAYRSGTDTEYQTAVFDRYAALLRNTPLWPALGNHDARRSAYFHIFDLPRNGEAGGSASGVENYYSFDYANIHFVCLDSHASDRRSDGEMASWLKRDLAGTRQEWLIAFWHHPPYSKGTHDSDDPSDSKGRMREMRENFLPLLESAGVDLVLAGHSHNYERSYLLDGHYGESGTLDPAMILDHGDGRPEGGGAYRKPTPGLGPHEGTVYAVVGSSSKIAPGPLDHPVMSASLLTEGSLMIDIDGLRLDAHFVDAGGVARDQFAIEKGEAAGPAALAGSEATGPVS